MKLHALCASAVALTLALSSPAKAENVDREFITLATISYTVIQKSQAMSSSTEALGKQPTRSALTSTPTARQP
jgi:hypothetical protein